MKTRKILHHSTNKEEIKPVNPKRNQTWILIGRTDAGSEAPALLPPNAKGQLIGKDPDAGRAWRQKEKVVTEDKMVDGITKTMHMNLSKLQEIVEDRGAWCAAAHEVEKSQMWLSDWITTANNKKIQLTLEQHKG